MEARSLHMAIDARMHALPSLAAHLSGLDAARFAREAARRLGDHLAAIRHVAGVGPIRWSRCRSTDSRPAPGPCRDAGHGIHQIAGQGLNLGIQDVSPLADLVIAAVGAREDPGGDALLRRYDAARRSAMLAMTTMTDERHRLSSNDLPRCVWRATSASPRSTKSTR